MSASAAYLLLPAPDASWRLWKPQGTRTEETVENPASYESKGRSLVVGVPASACLTLSWVLPMADHTVLSQMVEAQLEKRGLRGPQGTVAAHRWHLLGQIGTRAVVSVDVLAEPFPADLIQNEAQDYTAALRLTKVPTGHLVIIEEQGDLIIALGHQGRLFHSHIFALGSASTEEIAREIKLTQLALEPDLGLEAMAAVALVGDTWEPNTVKELERLVGMPVRNLSDLPPTATQDAGASDVLLPPSVREAQAERTRKHKLTRHATLGALLFVSLAFLAFAYLTSLERRAETLSAEIAETSGPAEAVKATAERWTALAPAIESRLYPMNLLSEITKILPPSGIVIREFEVKGGSIKIDGEARDAQMAFQFLEDLKKHSLLSRYAWNMPQPSVKEKTATFSVQGKPL